MSLKFSSVCLILQCLCISFQGLPIPDLAHKKLPISEAFHMLQLVKSQLFYILEARIRYPLRPAPPGILICCW